MCLHTPFVLLKALECATCIRVRLSAQLKPSPANIYIIKSAHVQKRTLLCLWKLAVQAKIHLENKFYNKPSKSWKLVAGRWAGACISDHLPLRLLPVLQKLLGGFTRTSCSVFLLIYQQRVEISSGSLSNINLMRENWKDWTVCALIYFFFPHFNVYFYETVLRFFPGLTL